MTADPPIPAGAQLGPYELLAPIGAGGMGQVFRARDTRLGRTVAIKVLPPHMSLNPSFRMRFEQEARAVSALSHPNVCALFDVGQTVVPIGGKTVDVSYLVMEYLDGEDLRSRLEKGPLPIRRALQYAVQIASGLAAAHEQGVIHRDLKPENVFITRGNVVKLLDFGLAKIAPVSSSTAETQLQTEPGMIMGTVGYMSPEQVRGEALDARSDIFSCGALLYEMLSGIQPFKQPNPVETMGAILHDEPPDLAALVPNLPPGVPHVVARCLEKDRNARFGSARDLAFSLEALSFPSGTQTSSARREAIRRAARRFSRRRIFAMIALLTLVVGIASVARMMDRTDASEPPSIRTLTYSGSDSAPASSPDGRMLAFVSSRDGARRIWLKQWSDGTEVALTEGPDDFAPRFSPDGSSVLFTRGEGNGFAIYRVPVVGGPSRKLIENGFDADFSPDGNTIAFLRDREQAQQRFSTVCIAPLTAGGVEELAATATEEFRHPRWSPDGSRIAVTSHPRGTRRGASVLLLPPGGGEPRTLSSSRPHGAISGVAWSGNDAVVYAELEPATVFSVSQRGGPGRLVRHDLRTGAARTLLWNAHATADALAIAGEGRIVFAEDSTGQRLLEMALDGSGRHWLTRGVGIDRQPSYSPDGARVVFSSDRSGSDVDVWEVAIRSGSIRRLTDHPALDWDPVISGDGTRLLWGSNRGGHFEIWTASIDGGSPRVVTADGVDAENPSTPRDGSWIYYDASNPQKEGLWRIRPDGSGAERMLAGETVHPEVSADGQYVVYQRPTGDGTSAIDVLRIADRKVLPLAGGLRLIARPRWVGATHAIAYRAVDGQRRVGIHVQELGSADRRPIAGFDGETTIESFAISPDGTRIVLSMLEPSSALMSAEGVAGVGEAR